MSHQPLCNNDLSFSTFVKGEGKGSEHGVTVSLEGEIVTKWDCYENI